MLYHKNIESFIGPKDMTLIPHKKILTKVAFVVMLCTILTATDRPDLQRRNSFKKLEDFRAAENKKNGKKVLYEERDGGFRPYGLMDDVTEVGQSSQKIKEIEDKRRALIQNAAKEGFFLLNDFMQLNDQQIQNVREVVIFLNESYFGYNDQRKDDLNRRLERNPKIILVLNCQGKSNIAKNCLAFINMRKIRIIHAENVLSIEDGFLSSCPKLTALDLRPLSNVKNIADRFLSHCYDLTALDLSPLSNVTSIGRDFLSLCEGLTTLDLSPLSKVNSIERDFLFGCSGLTTLDLSPLSNVTSIGAYFLQSCRRLTTLDLRPFSNVKTIKGHFLFGCTGLRTLDLSPLSNVNTIGGNFLTNCTGLRTLDLTALSNMTSIEEGFLEGCTGLTTLDLTALSKVNRIGWGFLAGCTGLRTLDLTPLSNVNSIGRRFLSGCKGLARVDLTPLSNVNSIEEGFIEGCEQLIRENVITPQNWRFKNRLPEHLRPIRENVFANHFYSFVSNLTGNRRAVDLIPEFLVPFIDTLKRLKPNAPLDSKIHEAIFNDLRRRGIDPKRAGSDYTSAEYGIASTLLQGAGQLPEAYLRRLEEVFSTDRAKKLLEDIIYAEDHSSDSDGSDH
ncbi:MAG: hypothetical protein NEHIOOID_00030 [Holosporales bacterium]